MAGQFRLGVQFPEDTKKLFKKKAWNDAMRAAMLRAGRTFVVTRLPPRFGPFAKELGYNAKKMGKELTREQHIRLALWMMRRDGSYQRIVASRMGRWGGWDATDKAGPPAHIWKAWVTDALKSGKINASKTGEWATARRKMRDEALRETNLRDRLRNWAIDEYIDQDKVIDEQTPLVSTGWLLKNHQKNARVTARATGNSQVMSIAVSRGQRTHKQVNKVLSNYTAAEAETVRLEVFNQMSAWVSGAKITTNRKSVQRAAFSSSAQKSITRANTSGAHKNRTTNGAPPRKVA